MVHGFQTTCWLGTKITGIATPLLCFMIRFGSSKRELLILQLPVYMFGLNITMTDGLLMRETGTSDLPFTHSFF
jgi:hypothetical protein